ncbi:MAG: hypothetical protein AVDCRST_MAG93-6650 [uncultured Chloroflexia bacterium]|uniref:DNA primase/polymerase bifunctional N-terminal domain-containing protein n=1 Tax=uncultured Chloroflexia bacterium TaxID=1672391 RepID=A0A6J4LSK9_9CHLR|nr:MAG: hypothetical protein AVDCRST_MAG93-6650 [uncultured Chloroflexia bacterium]
MESTESIPNTKNAARDYINRGWSVVPIPYGEKGPNLPEWQKLRITADEVGEFFVGESNIGIHLGEASGGLTDVDLDCPQAEHAGSRLLPKTLTSGRGNKVTHYWYVSPGSKSYKFKGVDGEVIAEIRADSHQTVVAPSVHPSGASYEWKDEREPQEIEAQELRSCAARVAAASLIARNLPDGGRHDLALAYAGLMLKNLMDLGEDQDDAAQYVEDLLGCAWEYHQADNEAFDDLHTIVRTTAEKIKADEPVMGAPTLGELLEHGEQIVKRLKDWFGWGDLTPEQREQVEQRKRAKHAEKAWADERVRELVHQQDILSRAYQTMRDGGLVGEERNAKLLTLVAVTMYLGRPMSVLIGGESSGGKSYLLKQLIKTLPESMVVELQSVSNMGLAYMGKDALKMKFLALYELGGLGKEGSEAIEQLKQLLTEGCIKRQIAESTNKGVGGRTVELDGPTGVWSTSTEMRIDKELGNRLFRIAIDESPEQTRRIIKARGQRNGGAADYEPIKGLHTYIAGQDNRVVVPFEDALTDLIDVSATRMRRDHERVMDLVEAHVILHQEGRKRNGDGRIVATLEDYAAVYNLIADIVGEASEVAVSDTVRTTVETVRELIHEDKPVTRNTLAEKLGIVPTSAGRRFAPATAAGYVKEDPDNPNMKPKRYVLGDVALPENVEVIPSPETLRSCVSALRARGEDASKEHRASEDFSNARSGASVHAPSSPPVSITNQEHDTYGESAEALHEKDPTVGVVQKPTHGRTILEDEPEGAEKSSVVRASVRDVCVADAGVSTGLGRQLPADHRAWLAEAMREPPTIRGWSPEEEPPKFDLKGPVERVRRERQKWADFFEENPHLRLSPDDIDPLGDERKCPYCGEFTHEDDCPSCEEPLP